MAGPACTRPSVPSTGHHCQVETPQGTPQPDPRPRKQGRLGTPPILGAFRADHGVTAPPVPLQDPPQTWTARGLGRETGVTILSVSSPSAQRHGEPLGGALVLRAGLAGGVSGALTAPERPGVWVPDSESAAARTRLAGAGARGLGPDKPPPRPVALLCVKLLAARCHGFSTVQ